MRRLVRHTNATMLICCSRSCIAVRRPPHGCRVWFDGAVGTRCHASLSRLSWQARRCWGCWPASLSSHHRLPRRPPPPTSNRPRSHSSSCPRPVFIPSTWSMWRRSWLPTTWRSISFQMTVRLITLKGHFLLILL